MKTTGEQTHPHHVEVEVRAEPQQLPWLRDRLSRWLRHSLCPADSAERVLLALNEAITNSMVHAYLDGAPGPVQVTGQHRGDELVLTVADQGLWKPAEPRRGLGGRGVLMMQECVDRVFIEHSSAGTVVTFELDLANQDSDSGRNRGVHRIAVGGDTDEVVVRVSGSVPDYAAALLRRQLLAATCGGVVPLTLDLSSLGPATSGASQAITEVATAAAGVGGKIVLVIPPESLAAVRLMGLPDGELIDVVESL